MGAPVALLPTVERRFGAALAGLRLAQKPGGGVPAYTRWINRRLARFAAAAAYTVGLSANAVTAISAAVSLAGLALVVALPATPWVGLAAGLLLALGYVLDSADGQVARLSRRGSPAGEWLDHVVDAIRTPAIHLAVAIAATIAPGDHRMLGGIAITYALLSSGQFMSQILSEQLSGARAPATDASGRVQSFVLLPTDMGTLCVIFLAWGFPTVFAWLYGALFVVNAVHALVSMRRKYARLTALHI
jgi:phosphatidylglycerophosphate synthase